MTQPVFLYAALCALILVVLSLYVIQGRGKYHIGIGDGGNPEMLLRMRIHANFIEYVPLALILIYFVQQVGDSLWIVHVLGVSLIITRLAHVAGLLGSRGTSPGRFVGIVGTLLVILIAALLAALGAFGIRF
jgi:uncharacterized membrane protein YecN with MAPEG domain